VRPVKPAALQARDTIGIISPSWFGGPPYLRRLERGSRQIEAPWFRLAHQNIRSKYA
jgi:hypothetical protein